MLAMACANGHDAVSKAEVSKDISTATGNGFTRSGGGSCLAQHLSCCAMRKPTFPVAEHWLEGAAVASQPRNMPLGGAPAERAPSAKAATRIKIPRSVLKPELP